MVCNLCDPHKEYGVGVELITISIPAIALQANEKYYFEIQKCTNCAQKFNIPMYAPKE